ncbi:hypothetical protein FS837_008744 [Tulasnella sp. UAMH 9824]|nr:hypothetical protein FS837_008744 [Tulasnella sp. UAMH 9824]
MAMMSTKRLQKELAELNGVKVGMQHFDDLLKERTLSATLITKIYVGETFAVEFRFGPRYPIESPAVVFVVNDKYKAPVHPHVYSNGLICASILGNEWSPVLSVSAVCLTLQSMLASCKEKKLPEGNDSFVKTAPLDPKKVRFVYDDDTV